MKASLGTQGVRLLLEKSNRDRETAQNMESAGESIETGESLEAYDHLKNEQDRNRVGEGAGEEMVPPEIPEGLRESHRDGAGVKTTGNPVTGTSCR